MAERLFFFNDTATSEIYTLSLHDALPICWRRAAPARSTTSGRSTAATSGWRNGSRRSARASSGSSAVPLRRRRSEEHTSELQSRQYLVCRLLLEKKTTRSK